MKFYFNLFTLLGGLFIVFFTTSVLAQDKAPTAYCLTGVITVPIPVKGCVVIYAKDLDRGSFDDVTPSNKLKFYFNGVPEKDSIQICCHDFIAAGACDELLINLTMWVQDEVGNTDSCKTTLIIQDNLDICGGCDPPIYQINGDVICPDGGLLEATINLSGPGNFSRENYSHKIQYQDLFKQGEYTLCIHKNDNFTNGVTTADIVKIQRHILGIESISDPLKLIAADVNASSNITAADISELRKLILGVNPKFSKVPNWLFIPTDSITPGPFNTNVNFWANYCRKYIIKDSSFKNQNFIGIKMGDVNFNSRCSNLQSTKDRAKYRTKLNYQTKIVSNTLESAFHFKEINACNGLQFTLMFDQNLYTYAGLKKGALDISEDQISLLDLDRGKIHFVWNKNPLLDQLEIKNELFSIIWKKKTNIDKLPILDFDELGIKALYIDSNFNELDLDLINIDKNEFDSFQILNIPNASNIQIKGSLSNDCQIKYSLLDIRGNVLFQTTKFIQAGYFNDHLETSLISLPGVYLLKLQSNFNQKLFKIILY
ncbi:MAG: T9SS type A sorting domain-containing protein [Saprospiraceae bacterium]